MKSLVIVTKGLSGRGLFKLCTTLANVLSPRKSNKGMLIIVAVRNTSSVIFVCFKETKIYLSESLPEELVSHLSRCSKK